jgi:hypothetical protein
MRPSLRPPPAAYNRKLGQGKENARQFLAEHQDVAGKAPLIVAYRKTR